MEDLKNPTKIKIFVVGEHHRHTVNRQRLVKLAKEGKINLFTEKCYTSHKTEVKMDSQVKNEEVDLISTQKIFLLEDFRMYALAMLLEMPRKKKNISLQ